MPHLERGMVPSTVDPDASGLSNKPALKKPVKLSAWKLAKLDSHEAMKAVAKARASSSVLRPIDKLNIRDPEVCSSSNVSIRSTLSTDTSVHKDFKISGGLQRSSPARISVDPSQGSIDEYETGTQSMSNLSSPSHMHESVTLSPLPKTQGTVHFTGVSSKPIGPRINNPVPSGPDTSLPTSLHAREAKRTSVVWNQELGRYVSVQISASESRNNPPLPPGGSVLNPEAARGYYNNKPVAQIQESMSSSTQPLPKPPVQESDKLTYTGDSIFFGGPLMNAPVRNIVKSYRDLGIKEAKERAGFSSLMAMRIKRDAESHQLPVFNPGGLDNSDSK